MIMTFFAADQTHTPPTAPPTLPGETALVTALIATRNRGMSLVPTIKTILASDHPHFELVIVDQSPGDDTAKAVAPYLSDSRVRYIHVPTVSGLGRARNTGIQAAHSDIVVITDDDMEVPPHWLTVMQNVFVENPNVAVAFCNVNAAPHDLKAGFVPVYHRDEDLLLTTIKDKIKARGMGGGMAVRRSMIERIGWYDEMLGAGAPYHACEDGDLAVRALLMGYYVYETARVSLLHFGFRRFDEGRELSRRNWYGVGAAYAKPLMAGRWNFAVIPAYEFFRWAFWPPLWDIMRFKKPVGITRVTYFLKGFFRAWRTPLDKTRMLFIPPEGLPDSVGPPPPQSPPAKVPTPHA